MGSFRIEVESGSYPAMPEVLRARDMLEAIEMLRSILKCPGSSPLDTSVSELVVA